MRKFLYSILAAGALMFAAAGCSENPEIDENNPGGNPPEDEKPQEVAGIEVYAAVYAEDGTWDGEWATKPITDGNSVHMVWNATERAYLQHVKFVKKGGYNDGINLIANGADWLVIEPVETDEENAEVYSLTASADKLDKVTDAKVLVRIQSDDKELLLQMNVVAGEVPFMPSTVSLVGEAGAWTANVEVYTSDAYRFVVGVIPAADNDGEAMKAFVEGAKNSVMDQANAAGRKAYHFYSKNADEAMDATQLITTETFTVSELYMALNGTRLSPSTEYKAVVFAQYGSDYKDVEGMASFEVNGYPAYYMVSESAPFTTKPFTAPSADAGSLPLESNFTNDHLSDAFANHNHASLQFKVDAKYTKVVYGYSDTAVTDLSNVNREWAFEANDGTATYTLESDKFEGTDPHAYFYVFAFDANNNMVYNTVSTGRGEVSFDSKVSYNDAERKVIMFNTKNARLDEKYEEGGVEVLKVRMPLGINVVDDSNIGVVETRYVYYAAAPTPDDVKNDLTAEPYTGMTGNTSNITPTFEFRNSQIGADDYKHTGYWYAMMVDSEGEYAPIISLSEVQRVLDGVDEEGGTGEHYNNYVQICYSGDAKFLTPLTIDYKTYFDLEDSGPKGDTGIWKQTVTGGSLDEWFKFEYNNYNGTVTATAVSGNDVKEMYLASMDCTKGVVVFEDDLDPIVNEFTKMFQDYPTIHKGEEGDEVEINGSIIHCLQGTTSVVYNGREPGENGNPLGIREMWQGESGTIFALVVVNSKNELTFKAIGFVESAFNPLDPAILHTKDMTYYNFR